MVVDHLAEARLRPVVMHDKSRRDTHRRDDLPDGDRFGTVLGKQPQRADAYLGSGGQIC
jgi:hypothetical protein